MLYNKDWEPTNPIADVLLKAADLLEKHGHTKHIRRDSLGQMCFLGALEAAQCQNTFYPDTKLTYQAAAAVATTVLGMVPSDDMRAFVAHWNNADVRTGQEVIDAMRHTAKVLVSA